MLLNACITNSNNVGYAYSPPWRYFSLITAKQSITDKINHDHVIYGGGDIANLVHGRAKNKKVVLWGVGATQRRRNTHATHPNYSDDIVLAGIRDYYLDNRPKNYEWVPCASCLHPIFDINFEITKEVAFFGHTKIHPLHEMNNDHMNFEDVITHIATAEIVVTTSYHGAYWATLLGKKVICQPYASKFFSLKHQPIFMNIANLTKFNIFKIETQPYPDVLEECRQTNLEFYKKVLNTLI